MCNLKKSTFTNWADLKQVNDSEGQSEGTGAAAATTTQKFDNNNNGNFKIALLAHWSTNLLPTGLTFAYRSTNLHPLV